MATELLTLPVRRILERSRAWATNWINIDYDDSPLAAAQMILHDAQAHADKTESAALRSAAIARDSLHSDRIESGGY